MPDTRTHRGPHPEDGRLFDPAAWPALRQATAELCWLLSRKYAAPSALKLVGDRHQLSVRQRQAVERCACSDTARRQRESRRAGPADLAGRSLCLDGYNVLTTVEVALELLGGMAAVYGSTTWLWYLDRPVSNSGRLKTIMQELAAARGWRWQIELVQSPDGVLAATPEIIATADSAVLDRCRRWFNLAREVVDRHVPGARIVPLAAESVLCDPQDL